MKTALLILAAAITITGCTTDRPHNPQPFEFDPYISSPAYPMTNALSVVTEQPINPIVQD